MPEMRKIFEDTVDNRSVTGMEYPDGGYKVITTLKEDHEGYFESEEGTTLHIPPMSAGTEIHADGETLDDLKEDLLNCDFSPKQAQEICDKFN